MLISCQLLGQKTLIIHTMMVFDDIDFFAVLSLISDLNTLLNSKLNILVR